MSDDNRPEADADTQEPPDGAEPGAGQADLASRVLELGKALTAANDRLLRALADQENFRRRADREREDAVKFVASGLARDLLPTIDNLRRAIDSALNDDRADEASRPLLAGVEAIERGLLDALEKHGVRRVDPLGQPFDPHRHEAMFEEQDAESPPGTVIRVLQPGYMHHDRLLRPAMVAVSKGGGDQASAEPDIDSGRIYRRRQAERTNG
jgi:molecular chaperone GrpE